METERVTRMDSSAMGRILTAACLVLRENARGASRAVEVRTLVGVDPPAMVDGRTGKADTALLTASQATPSRP
jgi:hypothetical protein